MTATDEKGMVTVFFELNGQPRRIRVPNRVIGSSTVVARRKAEPGNDAQVESPMPGVVSRVFASLGQAVSAGDVLASIEAMKMETTIHADKDGMISEILVIAGDQIDAEDLLVVLEIARQ
jgi:pyruvate carboxylase